MNRTNKHINPSHRKIPGMLLKTLVVFGLVVWFIQSGTIKAQVINNQGAAISVSNGVVVQGDTLENTAGTITNQGTIGLRGHYINMGTTEGNGIYNLQGNWINTGIFTAGNSTVNFIGNSIQRITSTGGEVFFNLNINNNGVSNASNRIILLNNVNVSNNLSIARGNIETGANILYLENQLPTSLTYSSTTGSRVIGKFERGVNALSSNYLFPLGSDNHYNPMNLNFSAIQTTGSVLSEFIASDPDSIGLPLPDPGYVIPADTVEVYDADSIGFWRVKANNSFASNDFDVNLSGSGFSEVQNASRIIKRPTGGDWMLDGIHEDGADSVAYRNTLIGGVAGSGNEFGWGHIRPRIQTQPKDTAVCDGESATFSIVATGRGTLTYEWEVLEGSGGWIPVMDNATYANSNTDILLILAADTSMNGYKYRVIVTDSLGNFHRSNSQATLTVNPRPEVLATPQQDTLCNGETTHIVLTSTEAGTTYLIEILNPSNTILGDDMTLDGDTIKDLLTNPTLYADSVVYRIIPYGPFSTQCEGPADTVVIWVEPTVIITAVDDTICDNTSTSIAISSENITTNGMRFTWTVTPNANIVGEINSNAVGQLMGTDIVQTLDNTSAIAQMVTYTITPWTIDAGGNNRCSGTPIDIDIWVEPTVEIIAVNDTICDGDDTNIPVTSLNTTTNGIRYTWTVSDNPNITGEQNSVGNGQVIGTSIIQPLINTSFSKQMLQYVITPWTVNASNENECTDAAEVITIDIWIDPTPRVFTAILDDTICNDTRTSITLTTPNIMTVGQVTFDYVFDADPFLTGSSTGNNLTDSHVIADSLHNSTPSPVYPQVVRYTITPRSLATGCADGPSVIDSITVHPTADTYMFADSVVCYLESTGRVSVLAENGVNLFTYNWDDPYNHQTAATDSVLSIGMYTVTVTDNQSCTKIDSVLLEQPYRIIPVIDTVKNVSCFGAGDAYIILDPTGGNGRYSYSWSTGETTDSIYGLDGALYYATVTDWKGCAQDTTIEVGEPPQISIDVFPHHVRCYGENNGWAQVAAVGVGNYIWSTGATTAIISNLAPGPYSVTATNAEGCVSIQSTEIFEPDVLLIDSINSVNISCAGDADGTLDLFVSGGNTDLAYLYNWFTSDGTGLVSNSEDQAGLSGGKYYVTVTDWRGCLANDSATIDEPPVYLSSISATDVLCNGDNNGSIDLTVIGGNDESPYIYFWESLDGTGLVNNEEDQSGLSGGSYYVTITDAKDCKLHDTAIIIEPDLLDAVISESNLTCFGFEDGIAYLDITGGTGAYNISWSNGANSDSIFGLSGGTYYVTITDENNCTFTNYVEITEPEQIENNISSKNITCFGYNDGEIIITPSGGTLPYYYLWSHSTVFTDSLASNLNAGNYSVSVIDNNNCVEISAIDLTQPDPLTANITKEDISCFGMDNGYISLSLFGGTPDYSYNWSTGNTENSANMLSKGLYSINVLDLHNCELDTTIEIIEPEKLVINPVLRRPTCPDIQDGYIELNILGGRIPYTVYWEDGSFEENLYDIRSGIYDVLINDSSLCEIDTSFIVRSAHDFCFDIPSAFSPNDDNINDKWVVEMGGLYPNAEIEIFDRWGNRVFYSKGYEESQYWDGTQNGKELPLDAYYYIIYLKNGSSRISGTVTLLR
ncbi:MAG TPA: hypothetical protein DCG75_02275 [Bacteroidales bacterium]|nr:hypothetical protein [Bacteroidales bacterium]